MTQNEKNKECVKATNAVKDLLGISEFSAKTEWYAKKSRTATVIVDIYYKPTRSISTHAKYAVHVPMYSRKKIKDIQKFFEVEHWDF